MDKTISYASSPLYYRVEGDGPPVFLLHGFAEDGSIWEEQVPLLKKNFCVILPDLPGSGRSPFNPQLSSIDDYAGCLKMIVEAEGITRCIMIGHSMGGYVSLAFAEKFPAMLSGLGLFHSTSFADTEEKKNTRRKSIEFIRQYGPAPFIEQSVPNLFGSLFRERNPQKVAGLVQKYSAFQPAALIQYYEAMIQRPDRTAVLKQFSGPVLFVIGEQDKAVPLTDSLQQCCMPTLSHIHIFENAAHMGMLEEPEKSLRILENFSGFRGSRGPQVP